MKPRKFITYSLLFFLPVLLGYGLVEYLTLQLPSSVKANGAYLERMSKNFEVLVLGSSQMKDAVNPVWLSKPTLNLASGDQHHDTDFKLLRALLPGLPNVRTVVLEVSYSHLELPHNGPDFWKNALYLKYYDVNCYERGTYFKDRLIYLSRPPFFSKKINEYYFQKKTTEAYNLYGFDTINFDGRFQKLNYDRTKIGQAKRFKINLIPSEAIFHKNKALLLEILDYLDEQQIRVIICTVPMYEGYLEKRNPSILQRRNRTLDEIKTNYHNVVILREEENTTHYQVRDFWNESHLNPRGAVKFSHTLNDILQSD